MTTVAAPICMTCKHFFEEVIDKNACKAFPDGIPMPILTSKVDHRKPYKGDNGIRYEQK